MNHLLNRLMIHMKLQTLFSLKNTKKVMSSAAVVMSTLLTLKDATPTSNFQPVRLLDPDCCYKFTYLMANSADPDQLASSEAN